MHDIILNMQEGVESTRYEVSCNDIYLSYSVTRVSVQVYIEGLPVCVIG